MGKRDEAFIGQRIIVFSENQPDGIDGIYCGTTLDLGFKQWILKLDNGDEFLIKSDSIFDVLIKYDTQERSLLTIKGV